MEQVKGEIPEPKGSVKINFFGIYKFIKKLKNEKFKIGFLFRGKRNNPAYTISGDVPGGSTNGIIPEHQGMADEPGDRSDFRDNIRYIGKGRMDASN